MQGPHRYNEWVADGDWLDDVAWDSSELVHPSFGCTRLLLDTNDPMMTFTAMRRADAALRFNAAACILPFVPKVSIGSKKGSTCFNALSPYWRGARI